MYHDILDSASWDSPFHMSDDAVCEVLFSRDNSDNSGYPIWSPSPKPEVLSFSDASESGWGSFTAGGKVAVGSWSLEKAPHSVNSGQPGVFLSPWLGTLRDLRSCRGPTIRTLKLSST